MESLVVAGAHNAVSQVMPTVSPQHDPGHLHGQTPAQVQVTPVRFLAEETVMPAHDGEEHDRECERRREVF